MTTISIEAAQAKLDQALASAEEAKSLLAQLKAQSRPTVLKIAGIDVTLQPGERYAGAVLDSDGKVKHHLVLLAATPGKALPWKEGMAWAESVGGALPDRQEQALLYANCKPHLKPEWHWSSETHANDASYAWGCNFDFGNQYDFLKSAEGAAVAVRRVNP